jgi:N-acyl-phosphatidylethanolamine-hydrolysing phospholipase D
MLRHGAVGPDDGAADGSGLPGSASGGAADHLYGPHHDGRRFFNPWRRFPVRPSDVLRWYVGRPWRRPAERPAPRVEPDLAAWRRREAGVALSWVGHSTFALHHQEAMLVTDPHFGPRALVPRRHVEPGLPLSALAGQLTAVLSHSHYDHLDAWTVRRLPAGTRWLVPLGLAPTLRRLGALHVRELDWWDEVVEGPWRLTCLPAQHWSRRIGQPRDATLWCSWLIEGGGKRLYFGGDSGYFPGFAAIGARYPAIDSALLPIGAYEPRWFMRYQHMDPAEALQAFADLGAHALVGMHWGTFVLTDEALDQPPRALARAAAAAGRETTALRTPAIGERWLV